MPTNLWIYRHGEAQKNLVTKNIVGGRSNSSVLTTKGERQAAELGNYFIANERFFDAAYSSPALRAKQTGIIALRGAILAIDPELQEISQGLWEGKDRTIPLTFNGKQETYTHPYKRGLHGKVEGGESIDEVGERMKIALGRIARSNPNGDIAIFGHDFATRCLSVKITGAQEYIEQQNPHCSETHVVYNDKKDKLELIAYGQQTI